MGHVRLTEAEKRAIGVHARKAGKSANAWITEACNDYVTRSK